MRTLEFRCLRTSDRMSESSNAASIGSRRLPRQIEPAENGLFQLGYLLFAKPFVDVTPGGKLVRFAREAAVRLRSGSALDLNHNSLIVAQRMADQPFRG